MDPLYKVFIFCFFTVLFPMTCGNIDIKNISINLSQHVTFLKDVELGKQFVETKFHQTLKTTAPSSTTLSNHLDFMVQKLAQKIAHIFSAVDNATQLLDNQDKVPSVLLPCTKGNTKPESIPTSNGSLNNSIPVIRSNYVLDEMKRYLDQYKPLGFALKQHYFVSESDIRNIDGSKFFQCNGRDPLSLWKNYMRYQQYQRKNVVLVLDHGGSLSKQHLQIAKSVAKEILGCLTNDDRVALIAVASDWSAPEKECADSHSELLKEAKPSHLLHLNMFIDSLVRGSGPTNHVIGIKKALQLLSDDKVEEGDSVIVVYISRGLLSSLTEAKSVLKVINEQTKNITFPVLLNTCAVIDELKPVMYETHFLRDIAEQNFTRYNISYDYNPFRKPGYMMTVNKTEDIGFVVNRFFSIFNPNSVFKTSKNISLPHWDPHAEDLTVSFTSGWTSKATQRFALLGVDVYFSNLVEDITYYSSNQLHSYAFLIDLEGRVLVHPSILRPSAVTHQLLFVDLSYTETVKNVELLKKRLLSERNGTFITTSTTDDQLEYRWSRVGQWYVICIVFNQSYGMFNEPFKASPSQSLRRLLFQKLDGSENQKFCRHLSQIATLDVSSLYLSSSCFQSPFSASGISQDGFVEQGYLAYLKDVTGLLINPGLKKGVKEEVFALSHILDFLKKKHISSDMSKYIVRRYAASYSGVLEMFPGTVIVKGLEVTKTSWFLRSLQHRNKTVFIPPYLDKGGAGYIITMAYATPNFILAMDLTYGYMLKMLLNVMPYCLTENITCFLIDDQGYIIYHKKFTDMKDARPVEQQHIVHRESLVANDILNHKLFIEKLLCNDYADNTIQRFYRLNTSFTGELVNRVPGEHCITYHLSSISGTNLFVGVVNASCDVVPAFCPCSIVDRLCLNCNRMEQRECECPCECPLTSDVTFCPNNNNNQTLVNNSPCKLNHGEESSTEMAFLLDTDNNVESCFPVNCQNEKNPLDCFGLIGCEWCLYEMNGGLLKKPFCSEISSCFNGVFGMTTPFKAESHDITSVGQADFSPLGPILGLIIAMTMLLILLFICYRSYTNPVVVDTVYLSSFQDQLRISDLNINENFHDSGNYNDKLLKEERVAPSPYCVAGNYRRNNTAAESDYGYSTMTPHDESEHLSLAPIDVADSLDNEELSNSSSFLTSASTGKPSALAGASYHSSGLPISTELPSQKHCVVVPVTVHRNLETT
ncbi:VWFA and cache domain-containing protein 1 [Anthonomus grandis grandis]|uniref:VWFA and cache domain-containing protein 1 n=1 Tax=Anthonomus grandis grandis TaxID=2921223 RepID=UPI0021656A2A|nr:VWFA and cache domain-containing protein 1 [Anthonomus grandis grandis]